LDNNPYAAAAIIDHTHYVQPITEPIRFDGFVHRSDVSALGRNVRGVRIANIFLFFGYAIIALFVVLVVVLLWDIVRTRGASRAHPIGFFLFLTVMSLPMIAAPLWLRWHFQGHVYAKRLLRISPRMIGPLKGAINNERIELEYLHYHSIVPIESVTGIRITNEVIGMTTDVRKLFLTVLPKHLFAVDDFERVCERLKPLTYARPLIAEPHINHDERLITGEPMSLMHQPPESIGFSGTLTFQDLKAAPIYHTQIRQFFAVLVGLFIVAIVLVTGTLWLIADQPLAQFIAVFTVISFGIGICRRVYAYFRVRKYHDQPIATLTGWITSESLTMNSTIGSVAYRKSAFARVDTNDDAIYGVLGGQFPQVVILPARMFKGHEQFMLACSYVSSMKAM